jgi:urease accessory protein
MSTAFILPARAAAHGKGRAVLMSCADEAVFSQLSYRYPLKMLSPQTHSTPNGVPIGIAYVLSYGGGLVSGDKIDLEVEVGSNSALMLLTQVKFSHSSLVY